MRSLLTIAAFGALLAVPTAPASAASPDCGKYGITCAKSATTASAAPALATRERVTTGRSAATRVSTRREGVRVGTRRPTEVRTAAAFPAATAPVAASTTTVRTGYGYGPAYSYGYGYRPQYWGGGYSYYQPAPAVAPVVTGRSVAVRTTAPAPAVMAAPAAPVAAAPAYYWGGYQPYGWGYYQPSPWPWFW
jgi:hypothetical protein